MITLAILFYNQPPSVLDCKVSPVQPTACAQKAWCILVPQANGEAPNLVCGKELGRQPISSRWEDGCVLWGCTGTLFLSKGRMEDWERY